MSNFSVITVARGKDDPPLNPYVYIVPSGDFKDSSENIRLTPKLMTEVEIDNFIDLLNVQLNKARNKAKKELQKAKEMNRIFAR
jgi:hypothetical protein